MSWFSCPFSNFLITSMTKSCSLKCLTGATDSEHLEDEIDSQADRWSQQERSPSRSEISEGESS